MAQHGRSLLTVGRYLIFYRPEPDRQNVLIIRILHGARDLIRALSEES